jgi:hypothetical protein
MRFLERPDCHLCHDAWQVLESLGRVDGVDRLDVDEDPVLAAEYGLRIPVLVDARGTVLAEGVFDADELRHRLPG